MRQPIIAGNWKMNGSRASIKELLDGLMAGIDEVKTAEVAVCAPFVYLAEVRAQLSGTPIFWGAQNLSHEEKGAFTGEIAASMLLDFDCKYVIVGHSERRSLYGEDDDLVTKKYAVAHRAGLTPILCVGETLEEREKGVTEDVVARQINAVMNTLGASVLGEGVIAYEPVWAIGTGITATPEQAQEVHAFIRRLIAEKDAHVSDNIRLQYGGSMNAGNAAELLAMEDIDGGLIGGASLKAEDFLSICRAAG
ncbi:MAG: triose-phosphate isomerase [Proteobacteria bacterium]|jgi:triosephosphate isomerase (TIM)|nr:triose-phosphate isomerase [Pseudomonadota bacterium]